MTGGMTPEREKDGALRRWRQRAIDAESEVQALRNRLDTVEFERWTDENRILRQERDQAREQVQALEVALEDCMSVLRYLQLDLDGGDDDE